MRHSMNPVIKIFMAALAIRWIYALALFWFMGTAGLTGPDSIGYISMATSFAQAIAEGKVQGWHWLGPTPHLMPLFTWLISLCFLLFGPTAGPLAYVLLQGLFDAGTCVLVFGLASALAPRFALPAAIAAIINPTQIVLSGFVYTDTIFAFFCALFLFASLRWLSAPSMKWAALIGFGLAAAALNRVLVVPWAAVLLLFLLVAQGWSCILQPLRSASLVLAGVIAAASVAPVLARNVAVYGAWDLTAQSGMHLAFWVVPLVKEAKDGTLWTTTGEEIRKRSAARFGPPPANPFEESQRYAIIGREALNELGLQAMVKAWVIGSAINLATPAAIISPPIFSLPRTGFFATAGGTTTEKIVNFLFRSDNALYAWVLLTGIAGVAVWRLLQTFGLVTILQSGVGWPALGLFGLWIAYILFVNGPIASPKYRLPIEPPLMVLTGAALSSLQARRRSAPERKATT
jgi:hypothetical protein